MEKESEKKPIFYPQLYANVIFRGHIECVTGLHIGGSTDKLEIGGLDSPVIRNPEDNKPYIPGSSLKGKMRHLLELATGAVGNPVGNKPGNVSKEQDIASIFGLGADDVPEIKNLENLKLEDLNLTSLIVRDAHPTDSTTDMWERANTELQYTETKAENTIDRLTSAANPRFVERVLAKSRFKLEMVYSVYVLNEKTFEKNDEFQVETTTDSLEQANKDLRNIMLSLRLLEASALGKSGSRGYGRVKFHLLPAVTVKIEDYHQDKDGKEKEAYLNATKDYTAEELQPLNAIKPPQI